MDVVPTGVNNQEDEDSWECAIELLNEDAMELGDNINGIQANDEAVSLAPLIHEVISKALEMLEHNQYLDLNRDNRQQSTYTMEHSVKSSDNTKTFDIQEGASSTASTSEQEENKLTLVKMLKNLEQLEDYIEQVESSMKNTNKNEFTDAEYGFSQEVAKVDSVQFSATLDLAQSCADVRSVDLVPTGVNNQEDEDSWEYAIELLNEDAMELGDNINGIQANDEAVSLAPLTHEVISKEHKIKFRPIKPFSPHLNGKVERSQKTDLDEFYSSVDIRSLELPRQLQHWEHYYNHNREHASLAGKTPWEQYQVLESHVPSIQEIEKNYNPLKEPFIMQNYKYNKKLKCIVKHKTTFSV